jgi:hypothetical protein
MKGFIYFVVRGVAHRKQQITKLTTHREHVDLQHRHAMKYKSDFIVSTWDTNSLSTCQAAEGGFKLKDWKPTKKLNLTQICPIVGHLLKVHTVHSHFMSNSVPT